MVKIESYSDICRDFNMEMDTNSIGVSGENIAKAIIEFFPIFRVVFMGDKNPITDFYVEISNNKEKPYPFLMQIKTTTSDLDDKGCLCVKVPNDKYQALCHKPIPTYVGGVSLEDQSLFIKPAFDDSRHVNSISPDLVITTKDKRDCATKLIKIQRDVINYWDTLNTSDFKQNYQSLI